MLVYSKKIIQFVNEIKSIVKEVLSGEIGVKVHGNRFYDRQMTSYPIKVVIFNANSMLGYFEADFYELGFHETLMHSSKELLRNVIRHELAHYMTFIHHGATAKPHSEEFRAFCQKMGWGKRFIGRHFDSTRCKGARKAVFLERCKNSWPSPRAAIRMKRSSR